jgi:hypothetical protein
MTESISFPVVVLGVYPATRPLGQEGRARLDDLLEGRSNVDLTIDFTGVNVMNISFADEFLGKFLTSHDFASSGATVKVAGLNADNRYSVLVCVERRKTSVAILEEDGTLGLLGDPILVETFRVGTELKQFKSGDIGDVLGLSPQNANNRLKKLADAGALRKKQVTGSSRGGKEFVYETVASVAAGSRPLTTA